VVRAGDKAIGVVTTRDTIRAIQSGKELQQPVSRFMSSPLQTVSQQTSIRDAIDIIMRRRIKRLFVHDADDNLIGMVTQRELVTQAYNKWSEIITKHLAELEEMVGILKEKTVSLERQASTDALTGLSNRAHFEIKLQEEIDRHIRYRQSIFSLIVLDVDHFKQFNDSRGHAFGDKVLKQIAEVIQKSGRSIDTQSRWGGDEFVILMPNTKIEGAKIHAERLRRCIEQVNSSVAASLSISAGIGEYREGESADAFFKRVDQQLYAAKTKGRNRVEHNHAET
jgi:diguanylate cyclase (GGDEF)-like protein